METQCTCTNPIEKLYWIRVKELVIFHSNGTVKQLSIATISFGKKFCSTFDFLYYYMLPYLPTVYRTSIHTWQVYVILLFCGSIMKIFRGISNDLQKKSTVRRISLTEVAEVADIDWIIHVYKKIINAFVSLNLRKDFWESFVLYQ